MRKSILCSGAAAAIMVAAAAHPASAALTFYSSLATFQAAAPGAQLIEDMESFAPKDNFTFTTIVLPQITFTAAPGFNIGISSPGYPNYDLGPGVLTTSSILTATGDEAFGGLTLPVTALGMDVYYNDFGPAIFTFFNGATVLGVLPVLTAPGPADNLGFMGVISDGAPITNFTFVSTNGRTLNTGIDNVRALAIPEPATWAMMIGGFGLAGAAVRRRRRTEKVVLA